MVSSLPRILHKVTLDETSDRGPALSAHNDRLWLGWIGRGNNQLNVTSATMSADGTIAIDSSTKQVMGDSSESAPALMSFRDRLWIAWTGVSNNQLNVMGSIHGNDFDSRTKQVMGDTSDGGPTLAVFGDRLEMGWIGVSNHQLNVITSMNGNDFDVNTKQVMGDTSDSDPALVSHNGRLWIAWRGTDDELRLNLMSSEHGNDFDSRTKTVSGSPGPLPSAASFRDSIWISSAILLEGGHTDTHILQFQIDPSGQAVLKDGAHIAGDEAIEKQALVVHHDQLVMAWTGTDDPGHLNIGIVDLSGFS
jgi:hypothetical protein